MPSYIQRRFPGLDRRHLTAIVGLHAADPLDALLVQLNRQLDWLWEQISNEFQQRYEVTNLSAVTVSGAATTGTFTFAAANEEPDTSYYVVITPITVTGAAAAGASRVRSVSKTVTAVTFTVEAAPGAGTSVAFDVAVFRVPVP